MNDDADGDEAARAAELAAPATADRFFALKDGDTFLVADAIGDVVGAGDGLFRDDTRVLSAFRLRVGGARPSLLSSTTSRDNVLFNAHLTNRPLPPLGGRATPKGVIHIERTRFLWCGRLHERLRCANFGVEDAIVPLEFSLAADFRDMFEVRGYPRARRGRELPPAAAGDGIAFRYEGLDGVARETHVAFSRPPRRASATRAEFVLELPRAAAVELYLEIGAEPAETPSRDRFRRHAAAAHWAMRARLRRGAKVRCSARPFDEWIERSRADLALLTSALATGPYPYAGVPWFSVPFGRDAIITALQTLWLDPGLARGVLAFLAATQAHASAPARGAAPGKILHETRKGEMTALGELPFGRYYGAVDTTPLFVALAGAYADRTGDLAFVDALWPALEAATAWIEAASGADGFLVYERREGPGLVNQGWKDSDDSVFHADGRMPVGPVALVEVQGYAYAALRAMARLAQRRGREDDARRWRRRAATLRLAVEARFWMEDAGFYGMAIDAEGALCRVRASNAGHLLLAGIPEPARAASLRDQLLTPAFDSGWGLRTLASGQARFNPMSYHNGSVWPHDTALCAAGMARFGERAGPRRLLNGLFEAALRFGNRLPELFCGFARNPGEPPVAYPVACLPQAWSAGSVFMLLQACLGLRIDGWRGEIRVDRPQLPIGVERLVVQGLAVGARLVDLTFARVGDKVVVFPEDLARGELPVRIRVG